MKVRGVVRQPSKTFNLNSSNVEMDKCDFY